jgi:hypothetical protein
MISQPECKECGSKEFVLIQILEFNIENFNEHDEPINYSDKNFLESEIKCASCRAPKKQKGR